MILFPSNYIHSTLNHIHYHTFLYSTTPIKIQNASIFESTMKVKFLRVRKILPFNFLVHFARYLHKDYIDGFEYAHSIRINFGGLSVRWDKLQVISYSPSCIVDIARLVFILQHLSISSSNPYSISFIHQTRQLISKGSSSSLVIALYDCNRGLSIVYFRLNVKIILILTADITYHVSISVWHMFCENNALFKHSITISDYKTYRLMIILPYVN